MGLLQAAAYGELPWAGPGVKGVTRKGCIETEGVALLARLRLPQGPLLKHPTNTVLHSLKSRDRVEGGAV